MIDKIRDDLKQALKGGDKQKVTVLRGLIASIQNAEISKRGQLEDQEVISLLQKESKKRVEAAELYARAGSDERQRAELEEKSIIDTYLPEQLDDNALQAAIDDAINEIQPTGLPDLGRVIGRVKQRVGSQADGARIATAAKASLQELK